MLKHIWSKKENKAILIFALAALSYTHNKFLIIVGMLLLLGGLVYRSNKVTPKIKPSIEMPKESQIEGDVFGRFEDVLHRVKPTGLLPFLLGWDGTKHLVGDLAELYHLLIAGRAGKGKSNFINQLIQSLLKWADNYCLFLFDFKTVELNDYKYFPQCRVFNKPGQLLRVIKNSRTEMQARYNVLVDVPKGKKTYRNIKEYNKDHPENLIPYIIILIDEFADLNEIKDSDMKDEIWSEIRWLLREGRAAGVYLTLATQRPTKENVLPAIKALMTTCIGFGVQSANESYYIGVQGAAGLNKGEFIINGEQLENTKLKAYLVDEDDKIYNNLLDEWEDEDQ